MLDRITVTTATVALVFLVLLNLYLAAAAFAHHSTWGVANLAAALVGGFLCWLWNVEE